MSAYPLAYDPSRFPAIPSAVEPTAPPADEPPSMVSTLSGNTLRLPSPQEALITGLWFENPGQRDLRSQSFINHRNGRNAIPSPLDPSNHFHFLPGIDLAELRWSVVRPDLVSRAVLELWSSHDKTTAILTKTYEGPAAANLLSASDSNGSGPLDPKELQILADATRFPGKCFNAAFGPYQLRLTVTCRASGAVTTAWTYIDVLVHSIALHWGPEAWIPAAPIAHTSPLLRDTTLNDEKKLLKLLKGVRKSSDAEVLAVPTAADIPVRLRSTMSGYVTCYEWYGDVLDYAFLRHRARWGDGPRIPLYAQIYLKRMDGSKLDPDSGGVTWDQAGAALGPVKVLFDWVDRDLPARTIAENLRNPDAGAFVLRALNYKPNTGDEPPDCNNCHIDRGGKRGGTDRIFPAQDGAGSLPFVVTQCPTRKWAAFSQALTVGPNACRAGVLLQPSRMAMDSYKITALLAIEKTGAAYAVDAGGTIANLLLANPNLPAASSGVIEIQRQIDARYIRKDTYAAIDRTLIDSAYLAAGLHIEWLNDVDPSFTGLWTQTDYNNYLNSAIALGGLHYSDQQILGRRYTNNAGFKHKSKMEEKIKPLLARLTTLDPLGINIMNHWFGCPAGQTKPTPSEVSLTFPSRGTVIDFYRDKAIRSYIERKIKTPKDKPAEVGGTRWKNDKRAKWNTVVANNPTLTAEAQRKLFFANSLTNAERTKVEKLARAFYEKDNWKNWEITDEYDWGVYNFDGATELVLEMCNLKILADPFQGVTFFHYINMWETIDSTGASKARNWGLGGVAKTEVAGDLGLKSMYFVWDHPSDGRRAVGLKLRYSMSGDVTAVHEFGHNLHLPHAFSSDSDWMHDGNPAKRGDDPDQKASAPARQCVMNYHREDTELCGVCRLRLRGWGILRVDGRHIVGFDTTNPSLPGRVPTERFPGLRAFFTDLNA
jgi:hypothetical protein